MRTRKSLQILILAAAVAVGFIPETFNGLSVLAILLASSVFLLQPGVLGRVRAPQLRIAK